MPANAQASNIHALYRRAGDALSEGRYEEGTALLEKILALVPPTSELHNNLGTAYWKQRQLDKAEEHYAKAIALSPANAVALNNYGGLLIELSRFDEAEKPLARAAMLNPAHPSISNNMGLLYGHRGDFAAAEKCFRAAIAARSDWSDPHAHLGNVCQELKRYSEAESHYRTAILLDSKNAVAWKNLGSLYFTLRRYAEAKEALERSVALRPESEAAWSTLLEQLELMSYLDEAATVTGKARALFPKSLRIATIWARLQRRGGNLAEAIAEMEKLASTVTRNTQEEVAFFNELGLLYDRAGDADKAFESFARSNAAQAARPETRKIERSATSAAAARLEAGMTPELAKTFAAPVPEDGPSPVFLVGFPRSGTTLLDQILSSHPGAYVAEEMPGVDAMFDLFCQKFGTTNSGDDPCYPSALSKLGPQDILEMRATFWREHNVGDVLGDRLFVDKYPLNATHAALIHAIFPRSKFILALRHPCDCVLSCFMQAFEMNEAMVRFLDLDDSARFYDEVFRVWEQTRKILPLDVHAIRYEDVVADFRPTIESLLSFLGLPWNDAVLEYDKTAKAKERIRTPSYHQVTQKIYTRAAGRWLRYRKHLEPILPVLAPHAARYGYSMGPAEAERDKV